MMMTGNSTKAKIKVKTRSKTRDANGIKTKEIKMMQVNLNHAKMAQDMFNQWTLEKEIELAAVQEPYNCSNTDYWFTSQNGLAAVFWNRRITNIPCKLIQRGQHTVAIKYKDHVLISCYSSPNSTKVEYIEMLDEIKTIVKKEIHKVIVCEDYNAKSPVWFASLEDRRGKKLIELTNLLDLRLANNSPDATCIRPQGSSIVDLTWCSADLISSLQNWKVEKEELSMSDHLYITFAIKIGRLLDINKRNTRIAWSFSKFDPDLFQSTLVWECYAEDFEEKYQHTPQEASERIDEILRRACDSAMPRQSTKFKKTEAMYWWSQEISDKRKECIRLRRIWKRYRRKKDRVQDSEKEKEKEFRKAKKELKYLINKAKSVAWQDLIKSIEEDLRTSLQTCAR